MSDIRNNSLVNPPPPNNDKKNILNFFKVSKIRFKQNKFEPTLCTARKISEKLK